MVESLYTVASLTLNTESLQTYTYQEIFWFYVSVDNIETVQVLDGTRQIEQHTAAISLCVFVWRDDCIKEIAPLEEREFVMSKSNSNSYKLTSSKEM